MPKKKRKNKRQAQPYSGMSKYAFIKNIERTEEQALSEIQSIIEDLQGEEKADNLPNSFLNKLQVLVLQLYKKNRKPTEVLSQLKKMAEEENVKLE